MASNSGLVISLSSSIGSLVQIQPGHYLHDVLHVLLVLLWVFPTLQRPAVRIIGSCQNWSNNLKLAKFGCVATPTGVDGNLGILLWSNPKWGLLALRYSTIHWIQHRACLPSIAQYSSIPSTVGALPNYPNIRLSFLCDPPPLSGVSEYCSCFTGMGEARNLL